MIRDELLNKLKEFVNPDGSFEWGKLAKSPALQEIVNQAFDDYKRKMEVVIHKVEGFVALFDVLGFKELLRCGNLENVIKAYERMRKAFPAHEDINEMAGEEIIRTRNYSDTFLIYTTEINDRSFKAIVLCSQLLFLSAGMYKLPLRGAISVGNLYISETVEMGAPLIDAYDNEKRQQWIGCMLTKKCLDGITKEMLDSQINEKAIVKYPIPMKNGTIEDFYALNWLASVAKSVGKGDVEEFKASFNFSGFLEKKDSHGWEEEVKHRNTRDFIDYVFTLY